ncbi:MAG: alpha-glucuronidase family glycosyl hydrolase, partial [Planctomycetia bacterium]|nr:alpha-glucuronidase family glycosyl hydrolase [Planctomycetia bacterium]
MKTLKCVAILLTIFALTASVYSADKPLVLAQNGKSNFRIVITANAPVIQKSAATELQSMFREMTGVELAIVETTASDPTITSNSFVIGPSELTKKLLGQTIDESKFGYDTLCIRRCGDSIVFTGHAKRGPLYAVNTFFEDTLGCRWWTSKESFIPKRPTLSVCDFDQTFTPKLIYRESYYRDAFNGPFAVKMRCNGASNRVADELGGHHAFQFFVHSFYPLIPPEKYYLTHPEWFSEIKGKRVVGRPGWSSISGPQKEFFSKL